MTALESFLNAGIGYLVSVAATYWLLPLWGIVPHVGQALGISAMFFGLSFARAYVLRKIFSVVAK